MILVSDWLQQATKHLSQAHITSARLDCLILLEDITDKDRSWLLAHPEYELSKKHLVELDKKIKRRANQEPLAYIRGFTEFYGRRFIVNKHVLEPRPETETMIELLKQLATNDKWKMTNDTCVIDIGTGSGALAITTKLELTNVTVLATDIDDNCLNVARKNALKFEADVPFYRGNLLSAIPNDTWQMIHGKCIILANLPYVPDHFTINQAAMSEPARAIFGGADGLNFYKQLFLQIAKNSQSIPYIFTESLPFQHHALASLARTHGYALEQSQDLIQVFRSMID